MNGQNGKGDACRVTDWRRYRDNWDKCFTKKKKTTKCRDNPSGRFFTDAKNR